MKKNKIDLDEKIKEVFVTKIIPDKEIPEYPWCAVEPATKRDLLQAALPILEEQYKQIIKDGSLRQQIYTVQFIDYIKQLIQEV